MKSFKSFIELDEAKAKSPMQVANAFIKAAKSMKPGKPQKIGMSKRDKVVDINDKGMPAIEKALASIGVVPDPNFDWSWLRKDKFEAAYTNNAGVSVAVTIPEEAVTGSYPNTKTIGIRNVRFFDQEQVS